MTRSSDKRRSKLKRALFGTVVGFIVLIAIGVAAINFFLLGLNPENEDTIARQIPTPEPGERINILVLGVDAAQRSDIGGFIPSRSDTVLLVSVDPLTTEVNALFIPRDTRVEIAGRPTKEKISHAHAHGGIERAIDTVTNLLDVPIHYYVRLDFSGFAEIVDAVGGVRLTVEDDMEYEDPTQDLYINIPAGEHDMDGETALNYVRFRNGSDIERIERQEKFIHRFVEQVLAIRSIQNVTDLARSVSTHVDTNLPPSRIVSLSKKALSMSTDDVDMEMVPGSADYLDGISYWFPDEAKKEELVDTLVLGVKRPENADINVEVLNGGGVPGAASEVAEQLEDLGYNVIRVNNAQEMGSEKYDATRVINHTDEKLNGQLMVRALRSFLAEEQAINLYRASETSNSQDSEDEIMGDIVVYVGADF